MFQVMRPVSAFKVILFASLFILALSIGTDSPGKAAPIDKDGCDRLEIERKALMVLGIDKYFENGVEWARKNLTVADLNLVKRYLNVYEQLKFRCKEDINITGDFNRKKTAGRIPPLPVRKPVMPQKAGTAKSEQRGADASSGWSNVRIAPATTGSIR